MDKKSSKKKTQSQGQEKVAVSEVSTPNIPTEVKEALVEQFRKMSFEGGGEQMSYIF